MQREELTWQQEQAAGQLVLAWQLVLQQVQQQLCQQPWQQVGRVWARAGPRSRQAGRCSGWRRPPCPTLPSPHLCTTVSQVGHPPTHPSQKCYWNTPAACTNSSVFVLLICSHPLPTARPRMHLVMQFLERDESLPADLQPDTLLSSDLGLDCQDEKHYQVAMSCPVTAITDLSKGR